MNDGIIKTSPMTQSGHNLIQPNEYSAISFEISKQRLLTVPEIAVIDDVK